jgi:alpha-tubulin suppressor-like RCC1 family protein
MGYATHGGPAPSRILCSLLAGVAMLASAPASSHAEGADAVSWGENTHAELAAGYRDTFEEAPVPVLGVSDITALAAGSDFSLALLGNGTVSAWGGNLWGQLGDGTHMGSWGEMQTAVPVSGLAGVTAIAAAHSHALALLAGGTVMAWGSNNYGQLGNGKGGMEKATGENQTLPKAVKGLTNVIAIASGGGSNLALLSNHTVMAWGQNGAGQLGIGETGPETCVNELGVEVRCSTVPRPVTIPTVNARGEQELKPLTGVASIAAGAQAAYAVLENGHVMAWGANDLGQLGTGGEPTHINPTPEEVRSASTGEALSNVVTVSGGALDALALLRTGEVVGWGAVGNGQLGEVAHAEACKKLVCLKSARPVAGLEKVKATAISAGEGYGLVVAGGKVYSFGKNDHGQLGDGSSSSSEAPTAIQGIGPVSAVAAGSAHALALLQSGVAPPPPLLSLEAGIASLTIAWRLHDERYLVEYKRLSGAESEGCHAGEPGTESEDCEEAEGVRKWLATKLGERAHGLELLGLEVEPYVVVVKSINQHRLERKRVIVGTPLP